MHMDILHALKETPLWLIPLLFATTLVLGIYVGSPIAISYYKLGIPTEVDQLFAVMPFGYSYSFIPLCFACAWGLKKVREKSSKLMNMLYVLFCVLLVPIIFYGVAVTNYYG